MTKYLVTGRVLSLALSGDPAVLATALDAIEVTSNRLQIGYQAGVLSAALSVLGHHPEAAELIGATSLAKGTYNAFQRSAEVADAWEATRSALGSEEYEAAFARGATRDYDDLVVWLRGVLQRLSGRDPA
jgi:hypothetical protein